MVIFLLLLGFIAVAAGVYGLGQGVPVRDTTFGAAMLVAASVAITGGVILVGLAAAVSELRRALRHLRLPDRPDGDRGKSRMEPRVDRPAAHGLDAAHVIPTRFDTPGEARDSRATDTWATDSWSRQSRAREPGLKLAAEAPGKLDTIRPANDRKPETETAGTETPAPPADASLAAGAAEDEMKSPPLSPAEAAAPAPPAIRPSRVLKSGTINDVSYTLFSDGSIETPTPEGTLRFDSIDEFRQHLEKSAG
jgi:hypothetical protein